MGYTMVATLVPLVAEDLLGSPRWSGAPAGLGTLGVAFGTPVLSALMVRRGRRRGLVVGYGVAALAALAAGLGIAAGAFPIMAAAYFLFGAGYAASRLSRYAAADLYDPSRRSAAIGLNVWAATLGSVAGPLLLTTAQRAGVAAGLPDTMGPFVTAAFTFAVSAVVLRVFFPAGRLAAQAARTSRPERADRGSPAGLRLAVVSLVVGQVVMVFIMTMTPIHIRHGGESLDSVGVVFAAHTFGMFAFSPIAGLLSDRFGRVVMIGVSVVVLVTAALLAAGSDAGSIWLVVALFLLGLGWCFSFVAASALLTESAPVDNRVRVQGWADSLVWGSAAIAGFGSGFVLTAVGYGTLSALGAALALAPVIFLRWPAHIERRADARPA